MSEVQEILGRIAALEQRLGLQPGVGASLDDRLDAIAAATRPVNGAKAHGPGANKAILTSPEDKSRTFAAGEYRGRGN